MPRLTLLALAALVVVGWLWRATAGPADPPPAVSPSEPAPPPSPEPARDAGSLELLRGEHARALHLALRVVDPQGRAVSGAEVRLAGRRVGRSDAAGLFEATFPRLAGARDELELEVAAPGRATWRRRVAVRDGEAQARARLEPAPAGDG